MDTARITINCSDGCKVEVLSSVRDRWELFDNRLEGTECKEEDERTIDVPFTEEEVKVWKYIDGSICHITLMGHSMVAHKHSIKYQVICRFFDPKEPYFWLFLRMDDNSIPYEERLRIYNATADAKTTLVKNHYVVREGCRWKRTPNPSYYSYYTTDGAIETETTHPRDIFVYDIKRSRCPIDYATQWHPTYHRRTYEDVYDRYNHYRIQCQQVNNIASYIDVLRVTCKLADDVPCAYRRTIYCWEADILHILGLDALAGYYNWTDSEILTPVQQWGRELIAPYTIRGIDKDGDERVVITKGNVRRFAHRMKELRVTYSVLFICRLHTRRWVVNKRLNRFMNILEGLLE